jgi:hypothetical protein
MFWTFLYALHPRMAEEADIWKYVNPDTRKEDLPSFEEPEEPSFKTVNSAALAFKDLDIDEREELRDLKATYKRKYKEHRKQKSALGSLAKLSKGVQNFERCKPA